MLVATPRDGTLRHVLTSARSNELSPTEILSVEGLDMKPDALPRLVMAMRIRRTTISALVAGALLLSPAMAVAAAHDHTIGQTSAVASSDSAGRIVDDYPHKNGSRHNVDQWNFYQTECVSFVAWRLNERVGIPFHNHWKTHWSNANNWDEAARTAGIRVDKSPAVGAIAQWNAGKFGHVAYVARVSGEQVTLEEYNKGGTHSYSKRTINSSDVENFIHFEGQSPGKLGGGGLKAERGPQIDHDLDPGSRISSGDATKPR